MVDGQLEYNGVLSVSIRLVYNTGGGGSEFTLFRYNTESSQWVAVSEKSPDFAASSSASGPSLLLGPQSWLVRYVQTLLSLVQLLHYCALIGQ